MLHHVRMVYCPKCKGVADHANPNRSFKLYGSPFRVCRKCGATYFDPGYHEEGIDAFNNDGVLINNVERAIALLVFNGAAAEYFTRGWIKNSGMWLPFVILAVLALLLDYALIKSILNKINAEAYHQKWIDRLEGRYGEMPDELAESMERLSDRKYLDALRSHGVDVPEYFYKRLGCREGTFVEPEGVVEVSLDMVREFTW